MPSDLAEIRRLVEGIGAEVNMVFPLGSHLADVSPSWSTPTSTSACTASSAACCARRWSALPAGADRPAQHHRLPARARRAAAPGPRALHRAREAHHDQADVGPVALGDAGLLRHRQLRVVAGETYARGIRHFLEDELGLPCNFAVARKPAPRPTTRRAPPGAREDAAGAVRQLQRTHVPGREGRGHGPRPAYIPASFPGAIIRRAHRHAVHGLRRRHLRVQEFCNALFDALFHILPLGTELDRVDPTPARRA
jgi:3,8-divinyl chlorophyllide a/chlorophyllide a reductase subunit Z